MIKRLIIYTRLICLAAIPFLSITDIIAQNRELPEPPVVHPGKRKPPSDAFVIFKRGSLENFESIDGSPADWKIKGKKFTVNPESQNIQTKHKFNDCQLHIEWRTPPKDVKEGKQDQLCGNSGVYLMGKYEVQILNSFKNKTYPDGQAGAIYGQYPPLVNASLKPGKWQTYDIIFTSPRFSPEGKQRSAGYLTVFHNGILIQNHVEILGPTTASNDKTAAEMEELPLMLQKHNNKVSYRNIWIRRL